MEYNLVNMDSVWNCWWVRTKFIYWNLMFVCDILCIVWYSLPNLLTYVVKWPHHLYGDDILPYQITPHVYNMNIYWVIFMTVPHVIYWGGRAPTSTFHFSSSECHSTMFISFWFIICCIHNVILYFTPVFFSL